MEVHINQIPAKSNYVILTGKFNKELFDKFKICTETIANASRLTKISKSVLGRYFRKETRKIRIDFLIKIVMFLKIDTNEVEKNVIWIGGNNSQGIIKPKLPFVFNSRASARFLAAICNEGWISDGAYYSNSSNELRSSVKNDALVVFGGDKNTVKERIKENDQYLSFPSIIRDILNLVTKFKGVKSENNPPVPPFILEEVGLMQGWIEQTIADEGCVKHYPDTYRREINWRRSFNKGLKEYKLIRDELKMLKTLGIDYYLTNIGTYKTKENIEKVRFQIRVTRRKNLLKLRKLIKIPCKRKEKTFMEITRKFVRYKEPLKIKEITIKLCKKRGFITSVMLKGSMGYKTTETASRWIKKYSKEGLLKCKQGWHYGKSGGRIPAKYILIKPKRF